MKLPKRILGLIAMAAAPVVVGCTADATEPTPAKTDQNIQGESSPAEAADARPDAPAVATPAKDEETTPRAEEPPTAPAVETTPVAPVFPASHSPGDICPACGMG
jgi:hypothetical protein